MNTEWSKPTRYIVAVGLALLAVFILYLSRSVFPLLILAALIAVIVRPLILWLHHQAHLPRGLAVGLVYLGVAVLVPLLLLLAIPALVNAVQYVLDLDYQAIISGSADWLRSALNSLKATPIPVAGLDAFIDQTVDSILTQLAQESAEVEPYTPPSVGAIVQSLGTAITTTFRTAAGVVGSVFSRIALTLFIFLASIYISLTAHTFHDSFMRMVPVQFKPEITTLLARIGRTWNSFFRGQLTLMVVIGVITWLGLTILGVPGAIYLGIIAGLLEIIPNLGPIIATIPAVIVALLQGSNYLPVSPPVFALVVILFYILVQQLENNLIVPRVLGEAVDLPALVVMTGVLVGAEVGGLLGALLATPIIATLRELVRYAYRKILGENPFPPSEQPEDKPAEQSTQGLHGARAWLLRAAERFQKPHAGGTLPGPSRPPEKKPGAKVFTSKKD